MKCTSQFLMRESIKTWVLHSAFLQNVFHVALCSLITNREPRSKGIVIYVKYQEGVLLPKLMLKEEREMESDVILYGGGKLSKKSFCVNCSKPILDQSRTRPRKRCEICRKLHIKKINKIHATRISELKRKETELRKMNNLNA